METTSNAGALDCSVKMMKEKTRTTSDLIACDRSSTTWSMLSVMSRWADVPALGPLSASISGRSHHVCAKSITFHGLEPQGPFFGTSTSTPIIMADPVCSLCYLNIFLGIVLTGLP